jgi:hypothetical protein
MSEHTHDDGTTHADHDDGGHEHAHDHVHADGTAHDHEHPHEHDHEHAPQGKKPGFLARLFGAR